MKRVDLSDQRVISARQIEAAAAGGATELTVRQGGILTPSARDAVRKAGLVLRTQNVASGAADVAPTVAPSGRVSGAGQAGTPVSPRAVSKVYEDLFHSPEAEAAKAEIIAVGKKLWQRAYVDGNGGNISYRIGENAVICTPTLCSKVDLTPEVLCLVDLAGNQLVGERPRTSEVLLHLEIYKSVPQAKAVVHCHPPHATAYAITGRVPPGCIIPEYEVFVGSAALSPYETPGTQAFAETVIPFVQQHNTVLLANHGIVCWADTVTHAEWYAEVIDTYCWTLMLAAQLGAPITRIPEEKAAALVAMKKKLGLPDPRHDMQECALCDMPEPSHAITALPNTCMPASLGDGLAGQDVETLVAAVTDAVLAALGTRGAAANG